MCSLQCDCFHPANFAQARAQKRKLVLDPTSSLPAMDRLYRAHTFMEVHEGAYVHHVPEYMSPGFTLEN